VSGSLAFVEINSRRIGANALPDLRLHGSPYSGNSGKAQDLRDFLHPAQALAGVSLRNACMRSSLKW
jgi:hypothetical protein